MAVTEGDRTIKMTALNDATSKKVHITQIVWSDAGAAGDNVIVKTGSDGSGDEIFNVTATAVGSTVRVTMNIIADGFKATARDSGTLLIYFK